uniref:O-antigen ligase family protein n=1 Tax=Vibrio splendidus TaxID=29497 RepID=UPI003CC9172E
LYYYASSHYHNQFLDNMVKSGTIGLLFIIGLLIYPLIKIKSLNEENRYIVIGLTSLFFIAGLTDVPFNHPQPLLMYLLFLVPICSKHKRVFND